MSSCKLTVQQKVDLASAPSTAPITLARLSSDDAVDVRRAVALNRTTTVDTLQQLAADESNMVRAGVTSNPNSPEQLLSQLAKDPDWLVRTSLARNLPRESDLQIVAAADRTHEVQMALARNPNCRADILTAFARGNNLYVQRAASNNPSLPIKELQLMHARCHDTIISLALACHPACPKELLVELSSHSEKSIRLAVAKHPQTPCYTLTLMAFSDDLSDIREKALWRISEFQSNDWISGVKDGLSLSMRFQSEDAHVVLGEALLANGLSNSYQLIQSAELQLQIERAISQPHTSKNLLNKLSASATENSSKSNRAPHAGTTSLNSNVLRL